LKAFPQFIPVLTSDIREQWLAAEKNSEEQRAMKTVTLCII